MSTERERIAESSPGGIEGSRASTASADPARRESLLSRIAPGILVAATGVGAGDLITASLAGSVVGLAVLWAALAGALLKWTLNEGLARWQMATGTTLLEGWMLHLGRWVRWVFMAYFFLWTYSVGGALINACGVAGAGIFPLGNPHTSKIVWGIVHSLAGLALAWFGGFRLFQAVMSGVVVVMVAAVLLTVILVAPDWAMVARGLLVPIIPRGGSAWVLGVLGGVGGTVTLLSYSYWIREKGRAGREGVRICRFDLGVGYALTALFGIAMVIIGSRIVVTGQGAAVALQLADQLAVAFGPAGKWVFLLGFWGAVFTSLLGVWQSVPYIFADFLELKRRGATDRTASGRGPVLESPPAGSGAVLGTDLRGTLPGPAADLKRAPAGPAPDLIRTAPGPDPDIERPYAAQESGSKQRPGACGTGSGLKRTPAYRAYLLVIALVPMSLLWFSVKQVQLVYAVLGALFMPLLALTLLILNNRASLVGRGFRNSWAVNVLLAATLAFFTVVGLREILELMRSI
jgi:Mn2+/Fe2+ NRAMP family transporter